MLRNLAPPNGTGARRNISTTFLLLLLFWTRRPREPSVQSHSDSHNLSKDLSLAAITQYLRLCRRQRMRLHHKHRSIHFAPAARIAIARFHKVDRPLELRPPWPFRHLPLALIYLDERTRHQQRIHRPVFRTDISIVIGPVQKLL